MNFKELLNLYSNNNINGQYSFSQESYMNINGDEKYLEINGVISNNDSSLTISENGNIIFNEKSNNPVEIANKLQNSLGYNNQSNIGTKVLQRQSGLSNYEPFRGNVTNNTQKIEINRKQSNKPKIASFK